jgi:hypothetical protein
MRRKTRGEGALGLAAVGSGGAWDISLDEALSGPEKWIARIEGPSLQLSFEIASPAVVGRAARFLDAVRRPRASRSLRIGAAGRCDVTLLWDDEHEDRCFLIVGEPSEPILRLAFNGQELAKAKMALSQVLEDLKPERLA